MITDLGKVYIKRYLAEQVGVMAASLSYGIGSTPEVATSTYLQLEVARADINVKSYDNVGNRIIYKARLPDDFSGTIYEVGLWSQNSDTLAGSSGSRLLSTFDSATEDWSTPTWNTTGVRVGPDSLRQVVAASGVVTNTLSNIFADISGNTGSDKFILALNSSNANVASVVLRLMTDSANYYTITIASPASGYSITERLKSSAVATGVPDWANIQQVQVTTTATAAGGSTVDFDALRIEDADAINPDYVLIARELLSVPYTKVLGMIEDVEFSLAVTV